MEVPQSLTLNEVALQQLPDDKKPLFIFEWLRFLDKVLEAAEKSDIKSCQQKLVAQLVSLFRENLGAPSRRLLAQCLATLFSVGDTFLLFDTVNKCNDIIKVKDDSPSYLPTRLAAICCLGSMYEKLGRMMGRSYEETVSTLVKSLKTSESQTRLEIMNTLEKICVGMGTAAPTALREVSRAARTSLLSERSTAVRAAAAHCLRHMLPLMKLTVSDVDSIAHACLRGAHPTDYRVRCAVAELLGALIAATQANEANNLNPKPKFGQSAQQTKKDAQKNVISLDEALNVLMSAFLRGGSSFLKGEIIKSGLAVNREVRVCVTNAYVIFVQNMGGVWLERNMTTFLTHVLDLVANPKAASSHVDAVYSRKCINYILRNTIGKMLGEKAQASACKEIIQIVIKQMNSIDFNPENAKDCNQETLFSQHLLVCALTEVGELCLQLGTAVQNLLSDTSLNMINAICSVVEHPCSAARLGAAYALRALSCAAPATLTPLLDRCLAAADQGPHHAGYAAAVAAILGAVRHSPLGIPHGRGKIAFNTAEQLLRSAGQSSRLTSAKTNAGWLIVGAICTLGTPVVRGLLPRMLLLWRNSFPRSTKELESEKARGDSFTWQVTLEGRAGALSALLSLLDHCPSLCHEEAKRLAQPVDGAVAVLANISDIARNYGGALKAPMALLRLRTYQCAARLSGGAPPALLRLAAADILAAEATHAHLATGLIRSAMHPRDTILLEDVSWIYETDHADIEEQLILPLSASGSHALEHDPCCLYQAECKGAQPLGIAVLDAAVTLFPHLFTKASQKHRQQMLEHFMECIKSYKGQRQEAIQMNVYTALHLAFRALAETKSSLGTEPVKNVAIDLVIIGLSANSMIVRASAASCVSRLCSCVSETECQSIYDKVYSLAHSSTNNSLRAAAAVGMAAAQRARGAGSGAAAVPLLRALAQDHSCTELQVWSVHCLCVMAEAGGPMFRAHVDATLALAIRLLFNTPPYLHLLHRCIGRLISALITVVGPELQGSGIAGAFALGVAALQADGGAARAEAGAAAQQLHVFTATHTPLHAMLRDIAKDLSSPELVLRRAALSCLRQLSQREANEVCKQALTIKGLKPTRPYCGVVLTEAGLPAALFALLDIERDEEIISFTRDTLTCCLLSSQSIKEWLQLCRRVLTTRQDDNNSSDIDLDADGDDDQEQFHAEAEQSTHPPVPPRWPTRVFAMECIQKLISACEASGEPAHFDLILAKEKLKTNPNGDYLSCHLPELIRVSFVCATSLADALRLAGLATLQALVRVFAYSAEPDYPQHLLLEQYQAQVGAALRPALCAGTAAHVSGAASDVCSAWLAAAATAPHQPLRRIHQLLLSGLEKLNTKGNTTLIYNESMATLEKLSILKAWAEVYIVAMVGNNTAPGSYVKQLDFKPISNQIELSKWRNQLQDNTNITDTALENNEDEFGDFETRGESLLKLVEPELENLGAYWLAALKDYALLSLPPEFSSQLPHGGGAFYSAETAEASRPHYAATWPSMLYAAALRYNSTFKLLEVKPDDNSVDNKTTKSENGAGTDFYDPIDERFHLLFGICMEALCAQRDMSVQNTVSVLLALLTLLDAPENRARLLKDRALAIEFCQIIHRTALTQESIEALLLAVDALKLVIQGAKEQLDANMEAKIKELTPEATSSPPQSVLEAVHTLGEGGPTGDLPPNKSLVFTTLEVALCFLVRRIPELSPVKHEGKVGVIGTRKGFGENGDTMLVKGCMCLGELPGLTSPQGALSILPTIIYLSLNMLRYSKNNSTVCEAATLLLQQVAVCKSVRIAEDTKAQFETILHSALTHTLAMVKNDEAETHIDPIWGAKALSVLIRYAAPNPALHYPCINHFRQLLDNCDPESLSSLCLSVGSIWRYGGGAAASWWARALAPTLIARAIHPAQENRAAVNVAAFSALAGLIESAPDTARVQLLWLLVPIVISYLRSGTELTRAPAQVKALHEFALGWLKKIGPQYPQELKTMMQQSPELRSKLELAVKAGAPPPRAARPLRTAQPAQPAILLKTDFSDFR